MTWSFDNISNHLPRDTWESFVDNNVAAGMMVGVFAICMSYTAVHRFLHFYTNPYRNFDKDEQLVVVHHTIEAIFLSLLFLPLSYTVASVHFEEQPIDQLHRKVSAMGIMMFTIIIMYMVELASRYQALRTLVVAHHLCAYADSIFPAFSLTSANLKASSLLVYFITYEAVIFVGLVLYRLYPAHKATSRVILAGMLILGLTRPIQLVWIVGSLAATWDDLIKWQAVIQIILTLIFISLQCLSLKIHYRLWKRSRALARRTAPSCAMESSVTRDLEHASSS